MLNVYCDAAFCPNLRVGVGAWVYIDPMTQEVVKEYDILLYPPTLNVDANYCEFIALKRAMTSVTTSIVLPSGATFHTDSEHSIRECASEGFYKESSKVAVAKATRAQVDQAHRYANEVLEHFRNIGKKSGEAVYPLAVWPKTSSTKPSDFWGREKGRSILELIKK